MVHADDSVAVSTHFCQGRQLQSPHTAPAPVSDPPGRQLRDAQLLLRAEQNIHQNVSDGILCITTSST